MTVWNVHLILILLPLLIVYGSMYWAPLDTTDDADIWFRPPTYVFAIVWPILLLCVGMAWYLSLTYHLGYILLVLLLGFWSFMYTTSKTLGFVNIVASGLVTLMLCILQIPTASGWLLVPLVLWLGFAGLLNWMVIIGE